MAPLLVAEHLDEVERLLLRLGVTLEALTELELEGREAIDPFIEPRLIMRLTDEAPGKAAKLPFVLAKA